MNMQRKRPRASLETLLAENPQYATMSVSSVLLDLEQRCAFLQAEAEDRERLRTKLYREHGIVSPHDSKLFAEVMRDLRLPREATMVQAVDALRRKKRRGYRQQEALEIWDAIYKDREFMLPSRGNISEILPLIEELETMLERVTL